ncbi:MAG: hypothetical protein HZA54_18390, partial [Planctomycetes bacterium]|nr:hypothetical protein [Planctomycetota bacterium]
CRMTHEVTTAGVGTGGLVLLCACFLVVLASVRHVRRRRAERRRIWSEVATALKLTPGEERGYPAVAGTLDGFKVSATERHAVSGIYSASRFRVEILVPDLPPGLAIEVDPAGEAAPSTVATGEPWFDDQVSVCGPEADTLASLDHATRRLIVPGVTVAPGRVTYEEEGALLPAERIVEVVRRTVELAGRLPVAPGQVAARLAALAMGDPIPAVRRRGLAALLKHFPDSPEARQARQQRRARGDDATASRADAEDALPPSRVESSFAAAALKLGLRVVEADAPSPAVGANALLGADLSLAGALEGIQIEVLPSRRFAGSAAPLAYRICVRADDLDPSLFLGHADAAARLLGALGEVGVVHVASGDASFDRAVRLRGDPLLLAAALDAPTRSGVRGLVAEGRGELAEGVFRLEWPLPDLDGEKLVPPVQALVHLARRFQRARTESAAMLAENVCAEAEPAVRLRQFKLLLAMHTSHAASAAAANWAIEHAWSREALDLGCTRLGDDALPVLERLAASPDAPGERRAEALTRLAGRIPGERLVPLLLQVVAGAAGPARAQAVRALGRLRCPAGFAPILGLAAAEPADPETLAAAAEALAAYGDPRGEPAWIGIVGNGAVEAVARGAAADALGQFGSPAAVGPLEAAARATSFLGERGLRARLEAAARALRARHPDVAAGRLSPMTPGPVDGALTVAAEPGGLALAPEPAPRPASAVGDAAVAAGPIAEVSAPRSPTPAAPPPQPPPR